MQGWGFAMAEQEVHTSSHSAVSDTHFLSWVRSVLRKRTCHLTTSIDTITSFYYRRYKVERSTLKTAPCHIDNEIAVRSCLSCSGGVEAVCGVCHILESRQAYIYCMRFFKTWVLTARVCRQGLDFPCSPC